MKPAICTGFDYAIPFDRAVAMVRRAGFGAVALGARPAHSGYDTPAGRAAIRRLLADHGLALNSVHAACPEGDRLFALDAGQRRDSVRLCSMALDAAAELGAPIAVIHLIQPYDLPHDEARDRMIAFGRDSVARLAARAAAQGVKLALENGWRQDYDEVLAEFLEAFASGPVGFCYDSGHEHIRGSGFSMLERFGRRLLTVHLHDNTGTDTHVLPFEGNIDWDRFRQVFHGLGYSGDLLLEVDIAHSFFKDPATFLAEARRRAKQLLLFFPDSAGKKGFA